MSSWNESQTITQMWDTILDQEVTIAELRQELDSLTTQKNLAEVELDRLERRVIDLQQRDRGVERALLEISERLGITVYVEEG